MSRATDQSKTQNRFKISKKLLILTVAGGITFWVTSIATSLLPIAAEYRAAFSNWSMQTVWIGSLPMGMAFGCCVSYFLLRFFDKLPGGDPIVKSMILSAITLTVAVLLVDVPMVSHASSDALYYFFIGVVFNAVRFLFLGIAVGYLYKRLYG